jgi:hypothetical protein
MRSFLETSCTHFRKKGKLSNGELPLSGLSLEVNEYIINKDALA